MTTMQCTKVGCKGKEQSKHRERRISFAHYRYSSKTKHGEQAEAQFKAQAKVQKAKRSEKLNRTLESRNMKHAVIPAKEI